VLIGWKAYYDDGSEYSSTGAQWKDLPLHGLVVVVEFYTDGSKMKHFNKDHYVLDDGKLFGTNDLAPYLAKLGTVKHGRWCADDVFAATISRADDASWP
jgi:hypothetical protein